VLQEDVQELLDSMKGEGRGMGVVSITEFKEKHSILFSNLSGLSVEERTPINLLKTQFGCSHSLALEDYQHVHNHSGKQALHSLLHHLNGKPSRISSLVPSGKTLKSTDVVGFIHDHLSEDPLHQLLSDAANRTPWMKEHCGCLVELIDTLLLNPLTIGSGKRNNEMHGPFGGSKPVDEEKIKRMLNLIELCKDNGGDPSLLTAGETVSEEGELENCP